MTGTSPTIVLGPSSSAESCSTFGGDTGTREFLTLCRSLIAAESENVSNSLSSPSNNGASTSGSAKLPAIKGSSKEKYATASSSLLSLSGALMGMVLTVIPQPPVALASGTDACTKAPQAGSEEFSGSVANAAGIGCETASDLPLRSEVTAPSWNDGAFPNAPVPASSHENTLPETDFTPQTECVGAGLHPDFSVATSSQAPAEVLEDSSAIFQSIGSIPQASSATASEVASSNSRVASTAISDEEQGSTAPTDEKAVQGATLDHQSNVSQMLNATAGLAPTISLQAEQPEDQHDVRKNVTRAPCDPSPPAHKTSGADEHGSVQNAEAQPTIPAFPPSPARTSYASLQGSSASPATIQILVQPGSSIPPANPLPALDSEQTSEQRIDSGLGPSELGHSSSPQASAEDSAVQPAAIKKVNFRTVTETGSDTQKQNAQGSDPNAAPNSQTPGWNSAVITSTKEPGAPVDTRTGNRTTFPQTLSTRDSVPYHSESQRYFELSTGSAQLTHILNRASQSEMRIGLTTPVFGDVEVRTVVRATDVGVLIGSEKGDLQTLLTNEIPNISGHLQQQNLHLTQVTFQSHGFDSATGSFSGGNSQSRSFQGGSQFTQTTEVEPCTEEINLMPELRNDGVLSVIA